MLYHSDSYIYIYMFLGNILTIFLIAGIMYFDCKNKMGVVFLTVCIGVVTDMAFSGAYWPSLLNISPSFSGLLSGISNCLATMSGFIAPFGLTYIVTNVGNDFVDNNMLKFYILRELKLNGILQ